MKSIIIKDLVYGKFEITEPILIELINSKPVQRLKRIGQHGLPPEIYHRPSFNRYEHSIGVMLLLRKYNANINEQIAGLLHDVSHTAFSHVADYFYHTKNEDFQDSIFKKIVKQTEIPKILTRHKIKLKEIFDIKKYTLLENELPNICADRIDYCLRELAVSNKKKIAKEILSGLIVYKNEFIMKNHYSAKLFSKSFLDLNLNHWASVENILRYTLLAQILKESIDKGIICLDDIFIDDYYILDKLEKSKNKNLISRINNLKKKLNYKLVVKGETHILSKKFRYIDPKYKLKNKLVRYSNTDKLFMKKINLEHDKLKKGHKIKILT